MRRRENWIVDEATGCWIWQGPFAPTAAAGYGPYRRIYEQRLGPVPKGHDLHHRCRGGSRSCVNPYHLDIMTTAEHRAMHARERGKLTVEDAREIRRLLLDLSNRTHDIAARYDVGVDQVERIGRGQNFKELGGPLVYVVTCQYCGAEVQSTQRIRRYCSKEHRLWMWSRRAQRMAA